ncbi:non-ribosomal peptide synthetase [Pseudomonas alkylphenolica]|uniref:Non-ribosomal peptide synthetase n=1 Tax=Pseudomonas alkylphenolica TaxID=237609 RepID=A0A443ZQQ0_9PSED|nr:non-ribosomal peptide synthetase [Pseudomonas alkylphenolica]RWU21428.1 non-ribosomal peptide synthetase [Pseudomonas alkylphenolica]
MNADDARKLARRFLELPREKRSLFLAALAREGVDFSVLPIPAGVAGSEQVLSFAQQRMWLLWQLDPHSAAYNLPSAVRLTGALDTAALEAAFTQLQARHQTLRSAFVQGADDLPQRVPLTQPLQIIHHDISVEPVAQREAWVRAEAERQARLPFDLACGPLLRVSLVRLAEQEHVLVLVMHHIVADGWSMNVLIDEFIRLYDAAERGQDAGLPALAIQYEDYALWQRRWLEAGEQARQLDYWRNQLGDEHPLLDLPLDHPRPARPSSLGSRHTFEVPQALADQLRASARQHNVTLFMLLLGAFGTLLHRYSGQADIRIGVPIANRNRNEVEGLIGFFVNTQVLRLQFDGAAGVDALLQQIKATALGAQAHQELPFEQLAEGLQVQRNTAHTPLFQVMYNHQPQVADLSALHTAGGLQLQALEWDVRTTRFDLSLDTYERGGQLHAAFTYRTDLFEPATIARMAGHWLNLLNAMVQSPDGRIGELVMLHVREHQQLVHDWNQTRVEHAAVTCIHHLIEQQAAAHPQRTAVVFGGQRLSYAQLNARANQLARHLQAMGVGPQALVGMAVERSVEMIVGLLAVLKAGAAYVPFDPQYPRERLAYLLEDSGVKVLLTQSVLLERLPTPEGLEVMLLDAGQDHLSRYSAENLALQQDPEHLAYLIYTSGSTGNAKGVSLTHRGLVNYVQGIVQALPLEGASSMAVVSTIAADLGHTTLFGALCTGCALHVLDLDLTLDAERFAAYMADRQIDVLKIVPSHIEALLSEHHRGAGLPRRCLVLGGEAASATLLQRIADWAPQCQVINHYGPTETTVGVLTAAVDLAAPANLALGRPLPNVRALIVDADLQPVPVGVSGELLLGGAGLARGYHRRPGLTAERFVPDPHGAPGQRLYRSGDLCRHDDQGQVRFQGRIDHQVKIRGYRIELEEISACLRRQASVKEAVTRVAEVGGHAQIVAYLVLADNAPVQGEQALTAQLREGLAQVLPEYMLPTQVVVLAALPLTLNGKLDQRALAAIELHATQAPFQAPVSALEVQLAQIWAQVLEVGQVGRNDNFFNLGGHSLLATQIISRVRRLLQVEVPLRSLFETATFGAFAERVAQAGTDGGRAPLQALDRQQPLPASFAQQRQWLLWTLEPHSRAYHTPIVVKLQGQLDRIALEQTFAALVARHEAFRTHFSQQDGQLYQVIEPQRQVTVRWERLQQADKPVIEARIAQEIAVLFDLERGPLLRVKVFEVAPEQHLLVVTLHHIISDGWSMGVLGREFAALYGAFQRQQPLSLAPLAVQYADYAHWQRYWLEEGELARQLDYWRGQLGTEHPVLELASDHPRRAGEGYSEGRVDLRLPITLEQRVRQLAQRNSLTLFQVFVASFAVLLHRYSGQDDIRIGMPVSNRNAQELEGVVGFFVNTLVLRLPVHAQDAVNTLLAQVRDTALAAQAHQDLPFDKLVEALNPQRSLTHNPLFQVMYNHLNTVGAAAAGNSLPGLVAEEWVLPGGMAQFELTLETLETDNGISASFIYAAELFNAATIEGMAAHWLNLLRAMVEQPQQPVGQLRLLGPAQWQTLLENARGQAPVRAVESVLELFAERVRQTPDAIALIEGEQRLSYGALDRRSNRLARRLRAAGVKADVLVAMVAERGMDLVTGLLAIFKAGGAYLPLDPQYPAERLAYMLDDSQAAVLFGHEHLLNRMALDTSRPKVLLNEQAEPFSDAPLEHAPCSAQHLAYVIYTSGSTGLPKGVAVEHGALAMHCQAAGARYQLSANDCLLQFASVSFDAAAEQIFMTLAHGAALVVGEVSQWSYQTLQTAVSEHGISVLDLPPSYLARLLADADPGSPALTVRACILGGEAWNQQQLTSLPQLQARQLFNAYGPTEAVISPLVWACEPSGEQALYSPIGRAVGARSALLLDGQLNPTPGNAVGELHLGGEGLARGYLRRPGLTAQQFVPDPFGAPGARMYRTGDLGRQRADGVIEYLGRVDHQVKIRGLRIELGEIEARLHECEQVVAVAVLAQPVGQCTQLVAYVVPQAAAGDVLETLKAHLRNSLPAHMVPQHWLLLEQLPLNANGKLDRSALPVPQAASPLAFQAPQNALQAQLAAIWAQVLNLEQVGITDNFFELGGDSIVSIQVVSRAREAGIHFKSKDLFQHQTVQGLATVARLGSAPAAIDQGEVSGTQVLLPIQHAFFDEAIVERQHWNQSVLLQSPLVLEPVLLEQALQALVRHHDALRLRFVEGAGRWSAQYHSAVSEQLLWQAEAADAAQLTAVCDQVQRSLDLGAGPLLRGALMTLADGSQRLFLAVHHLVVDGVSWRILFEDLQALYHQLQQGQALQLPARTSAYQRWAEHLQGLAGSAALAAELDFWQAQCSGASVTLPGARQTGPSLNRHARTLYSRLDAQATRQLLQQAPQAYRTQVNDLLLTALAQVLCRWTGEASALIRLEGHGRQDLFEGVDLSRTVGWFTSLFPLRLTPHAQPGEALKAIKEQLRAVPNKGIGYGLLRYLGDSAAQQTLAALPTAPVIFNYLGQFDGSFADPQALLRPAGESGSRDQHPDAPLGAALTLNGQVYEGQLSLGWTFSEAVFDEALIADLAADYSSTLQALIEHCCDPQQGGLTTSDVALSGLDQRQLEGLGLDLRALDDLYPLSPMQQGMLFHALYSQGSGDYVNQMQVQVRGLDVARFREAWAHTLQAHDSLRSGFIWQGDLPQPLQFVRRQVELPFAELDWREHADLDAALHALADSERARGFDLQQAPLLRLCLVRTDADTYQFIYTNHHILMDGWSYAQLLGEVLERYHGQVPVAPAGRYRDYIAWLQAQDAQVGETFWRTQLAQLEAPTQLAPVLAAVAAPSSNDGPARATHALTLTPAHSAGLVAFARRSKVTVNTLVQAAWLLLLQRYTGQSSVAFGATVAGRPAQVAGAERQIGLFINTLPVMGHPQPALTVGQWLAQVQAQHLAMGEHEATPLFEVQRWAGLGGEALFDTLLVFENYPVGEALQRQADSGLHFGPVRSHEQTHYPLALAVELGESLYLGFDYAARQFSHEAVARLAAHLVHVLEQFAADPSRCLGAIALPLASEVAEVARRNTSSGQGDGLLVHQRIAQWARQTPEQVAVVQGEHSLSFAELDRRANQLAHALVARGIGPEVRVAVGVRRDAQLLVALLAVLKAGGAYVPLDVNYPAERLSYLLEDSNAALLITDSSLAAAVQLPARLQVLQLKQLNLDGLPTVPPAERVLADNLAYIIYTSGSTGLPKGVAVAHGPLAMHCERIGQRYGMSSTDCELLFMSFAFDGAHERWLTALTHGGRLLLRDDSLWTPEQTFDALHRHGVTVAAFPPVYLQQLAQVAEQRGNPPPLRIYCFGGDAVPQASFELARRALKPQFIINGYGPTETVVTPLIWKAAASDTCGAAYAPIGDRVGERSVQVLDAALNLLPDGLAGELYLGGYGVARGYLNRPGLTAERFVPDPTGTVGGRLYRSGDLVRQRASGIVDCLGRIDHQVKIRGFRIELGEVEACLQAQAGVRDAVVVAHDGAHGKALIGYLVADSATAAEAPLLKAIKAQLQVQLPAYMVPAQLMLLDQLPLNPNGKVDRKALPLPQAHQGNEDYQAPVTELQRSLAGIWQQVLKVAQVGLGDNFFELGGHSLLATQATAQAQLELGVELALETLFSARTLADYAEAVGACMTSNREEDLSDMFDFLNELEAN